MQNFKSLYLLQITIQVFLKDFSQDNCLNAYTGRLEVTGFEPRFKKKEKEKKHKQQHQKKKKIDYKLAWEIIRSFVVFLCLLQRTSNTRIISLIDLYAQNGNMMFKEF